MKKLLITLFAFIGLVALNPSAYAIDGIIHDIADHTIGHGHHHQYYDYDYGYNGYAAVPRLLRLWAAALHPHTRGFRRQSLQPSLDWIGTLRPGPRTWPWSWSPLSQS